MESKKRVRKNQGTFRVNFNFPVANNFVFGPANGKTSLLTAPFILPPLQDEFEQRIDLINNYELVEVSVSQDSRCLKNVSNVLAISNKIMKDLEEEN